MDLQHTAHIQQGLVQMINLVDKDAQSKSDSKYYSHRLDKQACHYKEE